MRDALSLLDQALSFAEGRLAAEDVQRILGLVADEVYLDLFAIIAEGRVADVFRFVQEIVEGGYDLSEFYRGLADALRTLLIVRFDGPEAAEVREDLRPVWEERADAFSTGDLLRMLGQTAELDADGRFRKSTNPRILLEALLLRFAHLPRTVELEALIRAAGGGDAVVPAERPEMTRVERPPAPAETAKDAGGAGPGELEARTAGDLRPESQATESAPGAPADPTVGRPSGPSGSGDEPAGASGPERPGSAAGSAVEAAAPVGPSSEATAASASATATRSAESALRDIAGGSAGLPSGLGLFLRTATVREADDAVVVEMPVGPGLEMLEDDPRAVRALRAALSERMGREIALEVRAADGEEAEPTRLTAEKVRNDEVKRLAEEEPALDRAVQEWDLEMLD